MKDIRVKCRTCGCVDMYETTDKYDPDVPLTGDMLQLQQPFKSYNWPVYEGALADKSTSRFRMFCTRCNGLISTTGKLDFVTPLDELDEITRDANEQVEIEVEFKNESEKLELTPDHKPTYQEKMAKMKKHPSKSKSRRK